MNRGKWYLAAILGIALMLSSLLGGCTKEKATHAPDFTLPSLDGNTVTLSDLNGKPVVLTFWSIYCPACQVQMPYLQNFYNEWSNEEVVLLSVNTGDSAAAVSAFIASSGLTFPVLLDLDKSVAQLYGIPGVPVTFFIDAEGIIQAYKIGSFQSRQQIEDVVAEVFPALSLIPKPKAAPEIGNTAPDFTLRTIYGQIYTLSNLRGRTVLLNFWASTCPACIDELVHFQTVAGRWSDKELIILTVNVGEDELTVLSVIDSLGLTLPVLLDRNGDVCITYRRGYPTTFLIDENGIIRAIKDDAFHSPEEIESMLESLP